MALSYLIVKEELGYTVVDLSNDAIYERLRHNARPN